MQFNSVTNTDYTEGARAVVKNMDAIFNINRETSPDYQAQAQQVIESRSLERQTANKAIQDVKLQREYSKAQNKVEKIKIKTEKDVADIKRPAKRMAGITAALGSLTEAYGYGVERRERQEANRKREEREARRDAQWEQMINKPDTPFKPEDYGIGPKPTAPDSSKTESPSTLSSETVGSGATPPKVVGGNSQQITGGPPGKRMTKAQIEALATSVGFPASVAPTVARIAMGESSGITNNYNGKGKDDSYGLMQINMYGDLGPARMKKFGLSSKADLNDPTKNMQAAFQIWKDAGQSFEPWGAYTNGSYLRH